VVIAYSLSREREKRVELKSEAHPQFLRVNLFLIFCIFVQLILGAVMRHTHSGLAIPDFPTMGGDWWPQINDQIVAQINIMRENLDLEPVTQNQVFFHLLHRFGAVVILFMLLAVNLIGFKNYKQSQSVQKSIWGLDHLITLQIILGIATVLSHKDYHVTSLHVVTGAITLGWSVLLFLRAAPLKMKEVRAMLLRQAKEC
jgi:cytochrome c oxidase assembly protein subunit 15